MNVAEAILKKRNGKKLSREEIDFLIAGLTRGEIPDYQLSAFLMAVYFRGMDFEETTCLTLGMASSGKMLDLSGIEGVKVDKHSTGGVGDGVSLALAPLAAACGAKVPMMSGRGLGHTGGTLDKLEAIPGFRTALTPRDILRQVERIGCAIVGQTEDAAPADKRLYALRDVTATVDSIPLIASSILSKKFAAGVAALVLDVKTGNGAFMKSLPQSRVLAKTMVEIGKRSGRKIVALITDMNQPLGVAIGNGLEIRQTVEALKGKGPKDFEALTLELGGWMLFLAGLVKNIAEGKSRMRKKMEDGSGLRKFAEMVEAQGGDARIIEKGDCLPRASYTENVSSTASGYLFGFDTQAVGLSALDLGAGRERADSKIDHSVGIILNKKMGDRVREGEALAEFHFNDRGRFEKAKARFLSAVRVARRAPAGHKLFWGVVQ